MHFLFIISVILYSFRNNLSHIAQGYGFGVRHNFTGHFPIPPHYRNGDDQRPIPIIPIDDMDTGSLFMNFYNMDTLRFLQDEKKTEGSKLDHIKSRMFIGKPPVLQTGFSIFSGGLMNNEWLSESFSDMMLHGQVL
jgi:hypothetical protein